MLASSRASPYVYSKCFLHRGRIYVCEKACRYNGAAPRSSLPGRRNSGTWKCLSVQVIQMETDCNNSWCTFHPWRGEDCKHDNQIFVPCGAWRLAYLLGEHRLLFSVAEIALSGRSNFKASQTGLPLSALLSVQVLCAKHVSYQVLTRSPCKHLDVEHLHCSWTSIFAAGWCSMEGCYPWAPCSQKISFSCRRHG